MRWHRLMATLCLPAAFLAAPAGRADDAPKPEQLQQMYVDTLAQLRDAQQRKTQLASENEGLHARIAELEKLLAAEQSKSAGLVKQNTELAEVSSYLRSHYAAWHQFLHRFPKMEVRWQTFLESSWEASPGDLPTYVDSEWPWIRQA